MSKSDGGPKGETERGSALLITIIMITILLGILSMLMVSMVNQSKHSGMSEILDRAFVSADNAMARAKARLLANPRDPQPLGFLGTSGFAIIATADNASVLITEVLPAGSYSNFYRLEATGTHAGRSRTIEMLVEIRQATVPLNTLGGPFRSAIVSKGGFTLDSDIRVSGTDHDKFGNYFAGGTHGYALDLSGGVAGGGSVAMLNTSDVDIAARDFGAPVWTSTVAGRVDFDDTTTFWESDGEDNNFDSVVDEGQEFPTRVGHIFGLASEQPLIDAAKQTGTYFTNFGAYESWIANIGTFMGTPASGKSKGKKADNQPSGKIIYVDIDNSGGSVNKNHVHLPWADAADVTGLEPTLLIFTGQDQSRHDVKLTDVYLKHGTKKFNGMIVFDSLKTKEGGELIGSIFVFNDNSDSVLDASSASWANSMNISYSSDVVGIDRLPGTPDPTVPWEYYVLMWREIHKY